LNFFLHPFKIYFSTDKKLYRSLRNLIGFYPHNIALYKQAFRHRSASQEIKDRITGSNERLEFLGDAIISGVIAQYLFKRFPFKDEGFLTKMRSKIVSRAQLNSLALKMGLNKFIESNMDNGTKNSSINGDAFEALVGAIFLDRGYACASDFLVNRILALHIDIDDVETREIDFKSKVIEWAQKEKREFKFNVIQELGSGQEKQYLVQLLIDQQEKSQGQHFSKKKAEQIAAEKACALFGI